MDDGSKPGPKFTLADALRTHAVEAIMRTVPKSALVFVALSLKGLPGMTIATTETNIEELKATLREALAKLERGEFHQ